MPAVQETIEQVRSIDVDQYKYGFETVVEVEKAPKGLSEDVIRFISAKKGEPEWMLQWRLDAYKRWLTMTEPNWARVSYDKVDYNDIYYYAAPKQNQAPKALAEVDPATPATPAADAPPRVPPAHPRARQEPRHPAARAGDPGRRRAVEPRRCRRG